MENDGLFQMRPLEPADLEEFNALLRYAFQVTGEELTKTGWGEGEFERAKLPMLENAFALGWFYKENLASQIVVYPMQVNLYGTVYPMGGVTGVTTYPEYAGRGLSHALMSKCLEHMREVRQTISFLYPYSIPFYRRMGWELASDKLTFSIKDTQLPRHRPVSGMVERVGQEHEDLRRVYQYFAVQKHGALIRDDLAWAEYWRWDNDDMIAAIYYDGEHKPLGYLVYAIKNEVFYVKEMVHLNQEAKTGLWNYISSHFSMIDEVRGDNYTGEPLAFLFEDSEISETVAPYIMTRIVDVEEFLRRYPFKLTPENLRLHLRVHDPMAPWNEDTFVVWWEEGETRCARAGDGPLTNLAELTVQTLSTMLVGYKRPSYLYENDRLDMEYYMVQLLEQLIPEGKPCFSDYF